MRFAIISDLHANLEATEVVLADARERKCTHFVCLGDVVGYNANPHECVEIVQQLECPVVKGNHDEQASLAASSRDFNPLAEEAISWTREHLTDADKQWLAELRMSRQVQDFTIVHATLDTPGEWGYIVNPLDATTSFSYQSTSVCFFGHTHVAGAFVRDEGVRRVTARQLKIEPGKKYMINTGSVGQPRDGDWRAAYCIFDTDYNLVEQRRLPYDLATAQRKIVDAGLPQGLADRLAIGR